MTLTALRRTASGIAVVATTAGLAVIPALHADAAARAETSLSIRAVRPAVRPGGTDTIAGALAVAGPPGAAGREVTLEARPMGATGFTPVGTATARDRGGLSESVMPDVTTRYRWHYLGDTDARPSLSGVVTVRVRIPRHHPHRIPTSLSIRAVHHVVQPDGTDTVRGRLRAERVPLPHRRVILLSRLMGSTSWTFEGAHRTRRLGVVRFRVQPTADTAYRLAFLGTRVFQPARSGIVRVVSRPAVAITADPSRIDRGESTTVAGVVTDQGAPVAGATVELLARRLGATGVPHVVGSGITAADGTVSFTATPAGTTVYRLHLLRSAGMPGALSDRARVVVRTPTSLSIRGRQTATDFVISGELRGGGHALAHRPVTLMEQAPGSTTWIAGGTARTGSNGVVRFHEPPAPGTGYRLAYAGGPRFAASSSGTVVS